MWGCRSPSGGVASQHHVTRSDVSRELEIQNLCEDLLIFKGKQHIWKFLKHCEGKTSAGQTGPQASHLWPASMTFSLWINIFTPVCSSPLTPNFSLMFHTPSHLWMFSSECSADISNSKLSPSFPLENHFSFKLPYVDRTTSLPFTEIQTVMH